MVPIQRFLLLRRIMLRRSPSQVVLMMASTLKCLKDSAEQNSSSSWDKRNFRMGCPWSRRRLISLKVQWLDNNTERELQLYAVEFFLPDAPLCLSSFCHFLVTS